MPIQIKEILANAGPALKSAATSFDRSLPADPPGAAATIEALVKKLESAMTRLSQLERAVSVGADGSVTLAARGALAIVSDQSVLISGTQRVTVQSGSNSVTVDPTKLTVASVGRLELLASALSFSAGAITADAGMMRTSGTFQCDTMIANSVVGASYTPGAGNVW